MLLAGSNEFISLNDTNCVILPQLIALPLLTLDHHQEAVSPTQTLVFAASYIVLLLRGSMA